MRPPKFHVFTALLQEGGDKFHEIQFRNTPSCPYKEVAKMCRKLQSEGIFVEVITELNEDDISVFILLPEEYQRSEITGWRNYATDVIRTMVIAYQHGNQAQMHQMLRHDPQMVTTRPRRKRRKPSSRQF